MVDYLKKQVLEQFQQPLNYTKDCDVLAISICQKTKNRISTSTLRRVFGFLSCNSHPSKYTLDVLAMYIGYQNYQEFVKSKESTKSTDSLRSLSVKCNIKNIAYINSLQEESFSHLVERKVINQMISDFGSSDKRFFPLIGKQGSGKTCALLSWIQSPQIRKGEDYCFYVHAALHNADSYTSVEDLFAKHFGFELSSLEKLNQKAKKVFLIVDGLEHNYHNVDQWNAYISKIIDLFHLLVNYPDVKLILPIRPIVWHSILQNNYFRNNRYSGLWFETDLSSRRYNYENMPALTNREINSLLQANGIEHIKIKTLGYKLTEILKNPGYLHYFIKHFNAENPYNFNINLEIFSSYLNERVYFQDYGYEMQKLLDYIFSQSYSFGKVGNNPLCIKDLKELRIYLSSRIDFGIHIEIQKDKLCKKYNIQNRSSNYFHAFRELCSLGVLNESIQESDNKAYEYKVSMPNPFLAEAIFVRKFISKKKLISFPPIKIN